MREAEGELSQAKERERALTRGRVRRPRPLYWPTSHVRRGSAVSSSYCHVCGCRLPKSTPQDCPVCGCSDIADRRSPIDHRYCTECGMLYAVSAFATGRDYVTVPENCAWCGTRVPRRLWDIPWWSLCCDVQLTGTGVRYCAVCGKQLGAHRRHG